MKVLILYTNHRGETRERLIFPLHIYYGATEWHSVQWLLEATDLEKNVRRSFALKDILRWQPVE